MNVGTLQLQRRREQLYGPNRCLGRKAAKQLQQTDHIQTNLQRGFENCKQTFQSTTARSFERNASDTSVIDLSKLDTYRKYQTGTHIHFDSNSKSISLTQTDFSAKPIPQFKKCLPDGLGRINLADMAPRYMADKTFGISQYKAHFDGNEAHESVERNDINHRRDSMRFHKATHFVFGDNFDSPVSTTGITYRGTANHTKDSFPSGHTELEQPKSCVFREGDYNVTSFDPQDQFTTIQKMAFCKPLAAGMSMPKYFHILPRCHVKDPVSTLRKLLIQKNESEFKNPRDPNSLNVVKAFATYDQTKCGSISVTDISTITETFDIPLNEGDISTMLEECGCGEEGKLDFFKFCEYLTARTEPQKNSGDFVSTSMATYRTGPQASGNQKNDGESYLGAQFQTRAHFQLGTDVPPASSIYGKDFNCSHVKKTDRAPHPRNSKVMHEYPRIPEGISITKKEYIKHDPTCPGVSRTEDLIKFKKKQDTVGIDLGSDDHQEKSITMSSYTSPQRVNFAKLVKPVRKDYHHLESNRALPHPLPSHIASEAQDKYTLPLDNLKDYAQKLGENIGNRTATTRHNKDTHFLLGSDDNQMKSENMAQFGDKQIMDPSAPAAGTASLPSKGYSLTSHDSGEGSAIQLPDCGPKDLQKLLQQRNYLKNINPRDTINLNLRKAFLEYDTDLSGAISKDELKFVCKKMKVNASDSDIDHIIAICDTKGDGQIDYYEFALNLARAQPPSSAVFQASVTAHDFVPPKEQQMSESCCLILEKDSKRFRTPEILPSHYFHMNYNGNDCLKSMTGKDFIAPERM